MSDIKPGDLVMVVKLRACCNGGRLGEPIIAGSSPFQAHIRCGYCGHLSDDTVINIDKDGDYVIETNRLKKIDPPAQGDSLPTRQDLEVPA